MGRTRRIAAAFATAMLVAATAVTATPAAAQTTPTTRPRTTVPTVSPQAGSFPVLQAGDLPDGYRMGSGSPFEIDDQSARYPSVDDCVWNFDNPFSGLRPTIYQSSFQGETPVSSFDIVIELDGKKPASALYDNFEKAYRAAAKCSMTKVRSSSGSGIVNYGTVELTDFGSPGDEAFGATITPSSNAFPEIRYVVFRDGASVVQLRVADDTLTDKEFEALTQTAAKRAS